MSKLKKDEDEHYVAPFSEEVSFDELQDAPPSGKFRLSITGKIGVVVMIFWMFVAIFGQFLAPFEENDLPFPDDYSEFQKPRPGAWLGTDVDDRDILSRIMYGAGRTIGISLAGVLIAYIIGVTLGIGSSIAGARIDLALTQFFNIMLAIPTIMFGLVVVAALGSSIPVLIITSGAIFSPVVFRLSRALGMEIMVMDFVEAAKVRGEAVSYTHLTLPTKRIV